MTSFTATSTRRRVRHAASSSSPREDTHLGNGLSSRQITMISIGGVIGAGLFVGSSNAIMTAGPAVLLAYLVAAGIIILVMKMLGEMATAFPTTGSFSSYADCTLGRWAGFTIGWLYWWFYVLLVPIESIVAGNILASWFGGPSALYSVGMIAILTLCNSLHVKMFGEAEYWLSLFKVIAICLFIILGALAILGWLPFSPAQGLHNLTEHGGFFPQGGVSVVTALLVAMFSFQGTEIVTIAAAESDNPRGNVRKAIRSVVWRLGLFYIGSIFVVVCIVPWNTPELAQGSYQAALKAMNIPYAAGIMSVVVLVSVVSCLNSAIYTGSRMSFSLASRGDAPKRWAMTHGEGVPRWAIFSTSGVSLVITLLNFVVPEGAFNILLSTSGAIALLMYLVIAITQLKMRVMNDRHGITPPVRMWAFPYLTWLAILTIAAILGLMSFLPGHRLEVIATLVITCVTACVGYWLQKRQPEVSAKRHVFLGADEAVLAD
ncbi:amino acid permease [Zymobacter palmae]|uniref:Gamma-aminobutyrate permease n=1 Tax=Zymobacter palmae TaxID=33074 RepID=A0A348HB91_9GAMM|nr:amino acid permease [Zymobacter palmae]BBG28893.1 gamma-aminobutyrate permease [Zymobacter palmae]